MVKRKGIPISSYDFSIRPGEPDDAAKFAKIVCQRLQKIGIPDWAFVYPPFCKTDVSVLSEWHNEQVSLFSREHGGPSVSVPASKLFHIHWVKKSEIIIGFEWRLNEEVIGKDVRAKWDSLRHALKAKAPSINYVSDPTKGKAWPLRWQFVYPFDPLHFGELLDKMLKDTEERRLLVDSTNEALIAVGEVFGNDKVILTKPVDPRIRPGTKDIPLPIIPPRTKKNGSITKEQMRSMLETSISSVLGEAKHHLSEAMIHVDNSLWAAACSSMWKALIFQLYAVIKSVNNLRQWKDASSKLREIENPYSKCASIADIKLVGNEPALYMVANLLGWISNEEKNRLDECKEIRNKSIHPNLGKVTEDDAYRMCSNLDKCIWKNKKLNELISLKKKGKKKR